MRRSLQHAVLGGALVAPLTLSAQVTVATYTRALGLQQKYDGLVVGAPDPAVWLPSGKFWYRVSAKGGHRFVTVDPTTLEKRPAFDHERLASTLSRMTNHPYTPVSLPFAAMAFTDDGSGISFNLNDSTRYTCRLSDYTCVGASVDGGGRGGRGGRGGGRGGRGMALTSPDRRQVAFVRDFNVYVRPAGGGDAVALTTSGSEAHPFNESSIAWSPDSRKLVAYRVTPGDRRMVRYVESSPKDQLQPKTFERFYAKPGDVVDKQQPVLLSADGVHEVVIDTTLFPNPYSLSRFEWRKDGRAFTFEYNQRGHQVYRVIEVDATTGAARALVDEKSDAFIDYRRANASLTDSGRQYRYDIGDGHEMIWMSERDGWAHLYLYRDGQVVNQITKGNWLVRSVVRVDEAARQIWFVAGGIDPKQDPYFAQYYRIDFDGTDLTALTGANGSHVVSFSPDNKYYVDTWSRVDLPPVSQLRRASDAKVLMDLEHGDATALVNAGWKAPEVFVAKGRDGRTDIWGIIIRPTHFDPAKKYPVIENIYAGPQGSFVPKSFNAYYGMQALAELGFIVVQIDGMGTANRSKAFHDVAWKNLGDAGFPDRILWHKAVAKKYPSYDISRVGIYGGSAGGQNSLGGLLFHPDFYKAAVSFAGCHDNRMDKIWWNEQWMGWPIGPQYAASSNTVHAGNLRGKLLLVVGELDTNVDPSSTMQVVNALIKANKTFDLLVMPGEDHPAGRRGPSAPYGDRKLWDFFVHNLLGAETPNWNAIPAPPARVGQGIFEGMFESVPSWGEMFESWKQN
jgi:dipeptidyl aminopeptidase/acylaminoacyl peptidase